MLQIKKVSLQQNDQRDDRTLHQLNKAIVADKLWQFLSERGSKTVLGKNL
ncbi:MAG: Transposase [Candidatus Midichloria mitochondrii]|uniref:Transposase n=1 Tax=Midichloria mitochondrii (strain IricVA) TaxID=696127 RepID=F7XWP7_MIDMI|nr:hypothetical protein midi_00806 [Candidatus Midichloria mitochondrii IricVA]MDJ1256595.1 hypothetical protein [Candidatus Midichloria mitochondrii]